MFWKQLPICVALIALTACATVGQGPLGGGISGGVTPPLELSGNPSRLRPEGCRSYNRETVATGTTAPASVRLTCVGADRSREKVLW